MAAFAFATPAAEKRVRGQMRGFVQMQASGAGRGVSPEWVDPGRTELSGTRGGRALTTRYCWADFSNSILILNTSFISHYFILHYLSFLNT